MAGVNGDLPEHILQKNLNELLFYSVKVGFHSSPDFEREKKSKVFMYRI